MRATFTDSESLRVPLTPRHSLKEPLTEQDSLKEPFTAPRAHPMHPTTEAPGLPPTAPDAPNQRGTQPSPNPDTKPSLRAAGACQGIFPALTSTRRPSAQSSFGVPHATNACNVAARRRAVTPSPQHPRTADSQQAHIAPTPANRTLGS
ncbi:hypothetical protein GCM10009565_69430 [Amycolatopsis albidoflavus]